VADRRGWGQNADMDNGESADVVEYTKLHRDGTVWAKGYMAGGEMHGYWEWFRLDGSKMRSGTFDNGVQVGDWTTYRADGRPAKVTTMKPRP
jgi:antitoxin component YwqK of YwqJK toxin-antitoxin module